jgi:hypothetical protein
MHGSNEVVKRWFGFNDIGPTCERIVHGPLDAAIAAVNGMKHPIDGSQEYGVSEFEIIVSRTWRPLMA